MSAPTLPRYRCHKIVEAVKIRDIQIDLGHGLEPSDGTAVIVPEDHRIPSFRVSRAYREKHQPQVGGYYVRYPDGYESWSPARAFEEGYSPVE